MGNWLRQSPIFPTTALPVFRRKTELSSLPVLYPPQNDRLCQILVCVSLNFTI